MSDLQNGVSLAQKCNFNICVLRSSEYRCGYHSRIHIWLTEHQLGNANLMILLAYIIMGHPDWEKCEISVFAAVPEQEHANRSEFLHNLIHKGRLPISAQNVMLLPYTDWASYENVVMNASREADMVMLGFTRQQFSKFGTTVFTRFEKLRDTLFVSAEVQDITLLDEEDVKTSTKPEEPSPPIP